MLRHVVLLLSSLVLVAGCNGGSTGGTGSPCAGDNPDPTCAQNCDFGSPCPSGYHCVNGGTCYAECTGNNDCGADADCTLDGRCVSNIDPDNTNGNNNCPSVTVDLNSLPPTVVLLVDRSGSMTENFAGNDDRWEAVQRALTGTNGVVTNLEDSVRFGAVLYNSVGGSNGGSNGPGGECPILHSEPPTYGNANAIDQLFNDYGPDADTPTMESVNFVANNFPEPVPANAPKVLILATDGLPDNCNDPDGHTVQDQTNSVNAVKAAYDLGIRTYPLWVGDADNTALTHLQQLANAGAGQNIQTGTATTFVADEAGELEQQFGDIVADARSCSYTLDQELSPGYEASGEVTLNGNPLAYGVDYQVTDGTTLELIGAACEFIRSQENVVLDAEFPCGSVVVVD